MLASGAQLHEIIALSRANTETFFRHQYPLFPGILAYCRELSLERNERYIGVEFRRRSMG